MYCPFCSAKLRFEVEQDPLGKVVAEVGVGMIIRCDGACNSAWIDTQAVHEYLEHRDSQALAQNGGDDG